MSKKQSNKGLNWNLSPLFKNDQDPAILANIEEARQATNNFASIWKRRTDYLEDPVILRRALDQYETWVRHHGPASRVVYYFELRQAQNESDPKIKAWQNKISDIENELYNQINFFTIRLAQIPTKNQTEMLSHPDLAKYRHFLQMTFAQAKHLLSEAEEKIVALKHKTSYGNWVDMTSGFLSAETRPIKIGKKKVIKSFSELASLTCHPQKTIRDQAAKAFDEILAKYADVAEQEINSILANKKTDDELRHYDRPDAGRHLGDNIDSQTVDTMITTVAKAFKISANYYQLKARLFKVRKLSYHERSVPYGQIDQEISYPQAVNLVRRALQPLDQQFVDIFDQFLANGQIDVFPAPGKHGGAFCHHTLITLPTYILLNYTGRLNDALTIAHELGHGINNELIRAKQHALYFGTPLATAEVASTFMEDFVLQEITKGANDEQRLAIMMMKLNDDISTIFRQVACYRFEQELHREFRRVGYLAKDQIGEIFQKHMRAYMGPAVDQPTSAKNWWVYWSHIRSFFYVYSYASGLLISKALQNQVQENPERIHAVKEFLAAGLSESPEQIFSKLGLDISQASFWKSGLAEINNQLKEATKLAKKLKKIK